MRVNRFDHVVLTVASIDATVDFYTRVLGLAQLAAAGVTVEEGPVARTGATGEIVSCYLRDPDGNLIELSNYRTG